MFFKFFSKRIYLDVASSTPLDTRMLRSIPHLESTTIGANPHALHREGVSARAVIESARTKVATVLHAHTDEVIFTSGATESDNLALIGTVQHVIQQGIAPNEIAIAISDLEHAAVMETVLHMRERQIFTMTIPSDNGVVNPKHITVPDGCKVLLVSIMYVHNEIGTVQPIRDIAKRVRYLRKQHPDTTIIFHTDATQAPAHFSLDTAKLGVDLMTLGATKLYTHKGVGVLYKKRTIKLAPIMYGGGQQYGLRPGTEPIELIHMFAHALEYSQKIQTQETQRVQELQKYFEEKITQEVPEVYITAGDQERTPHITHVAIRDFDSELLVIELDAKGIAVSAKSACKNEETGESAIVEKMYGTGYGAVRFSFGRMTKMGDVNKAVTALKKVLEKYRK